MQDEILRTPATARLYLMLEQNAQHGALPPGVDINEIVRYAQQWHPQAQWAVIAQLVHTFLTNLTAEDRSDLLHTVRGMFEEYGEKELAEGRGLAAREVTAASRRGSLSPTWPRRRSAGLGVGA
ncbi:hypothetical protein [Streptomyces sp. NPDC050263]|uniref:hypothetical protein n=1 Tax=Streptomyces sp. NPDC050263 TaxID=3155037 RepID=UPI003440B0E8